MEQRCLYLGEQCWPLSIDISAQYSIYNRHTDRFGEVDVEDVIVIYIMHKITMISKLYRRYYDFISKFPLASGTFGVLWGHSV